MRSLCAGTIGEVQMYRLQERIRPCIGEQGSDWSDVCTGHREFAENQMRKMRKQVGGEYAGEPEYRVVPADNVNDG